MTTPERSLVWFSQVGERPGRELYWLSLMPDTRVTAVGDSETPPGVAEVRSRYRQPTKRFIEAGALAWLRDLDAVPQVSDWVSALEPFSLVTGQAARFAARHRTRLAVLMWHNFRDTPLYRLPPYRQAWAASRQADFFLCLIQASADHVLDMGIEPERVEVVHPGVDTVTFRPPDPAISNAVLGAWAGADPVVAFVSPLRPSKGLAQVLRAMNQVRRAVPEARLVIGGTGEDEPLARRAAAAFPDRVRYLGALPPSGVAAVVGAASVFVTAPHPTRVWNEQFGLAYVEAMACGTPVVTTRCGTNHEAVPEPNRLVADEPEALAEAILPFLVDAGLRAEVGTFNRRYASEHHDVVRQAARMGEAFSRAESRLG